MLRPPFTLKSLFSKDEINVTNLLTLVKYSIWLNRKIILLVLLLMILLGSIKYFFTPVEYESKATIIANTNANTSNINSIGSLFGINLPNSQDQSNFLGPEMYKDILSSDAFLNEVVIEQIPVNELNKKLVSIESYLQNKKPNSLLDVLLKKDNRKDTNFIINKDENVNLGEDNKVNIYKNVLNKISPNVIFTSNVPPVVKIENSRYNAILDIKNRIKLDAKDRNYIVSVTMPDKFTSAITCQVVLKKLTEYITFYKTQKQLDNILYIQKRFEEAKYKYEETQNKLANYKDNSLGIIFQSSQTREQILNNEMSVAFNIYNQLSVQLEQSKLDLKKESPVFSFLEPIKIPESTTSGNYFMKIILYILIGIGLSFLIAIRTLFKL
jgi:hypothetical protein